MKLVTTSLLSHLSSGPPSVSPLAVGITNVATQDLSISEIKRLFFIWFNSISTDNTSLNLSQFSCILNRIFSSSFIVISETKISQIFNQLNVDKKDECIYFNDFLSANNDTFSNIMLELLQQNDATAAAAVKSTLLCVPRQSTNNATNDTLQQILYEQTQEIISLKNWIVEIGLPSQQLCDIENRVLNKELSDSVDEQQKIKKKLQVVSEMSTKLEVDNNYMNQSYSALNDDFSLSMQQNRALKTMNEDNAQHIEMLMSELTGIKCELKIQKQKNSTNLAEIEKFKKANNELKKLLHQTKDKNDTQSKEIKQLYHMNSQIEIAMESAAMALEQKAQEIEMIKQSKRLSIEDIPSDNIADYGNQHFRKNIKLKLPQCSNNNDSAKRKSFVFTINDENDNENIPSLQGIANTESSCQTEDNQQRKRSHSIVSIGGGQKMNLYNSSKPLDFDEMKGDYKQLYHDETRGVNVYVFTDIYSPNNEYENNESDNEYQQEYDNEYEYQEIENIKLKEMTNKQIEEMMKLKKQLQHMTEEYKTDNNVPLSNRNKQKKRKYNSKGCYLFGLSLW